MAHALAGLTEVELHGQLAHYQGIIDGSSNGTWVHCSPELLKSGISCADTPRRACQCSSGGSHDHYVGNNAESADLREAFDMVEMITTQLQFLE